MLSVFFISVRFLLIQHLLLKKHAIGFKLGLKIAQLCKKKKFKDQNENFLKILLQSTLNCEKINNKNCYNIFLYTLVFVNLYFFFQNNTLSLKNLTTSPH